jgi:hypothetical protein
MDESDFRLVKARYENAGGDHSELFETIIWIAEKSSLAHALSHLERCVTQKRLTWLDQNLSGLTLTGDAIDHAYAAFYGAYLGLSVPQDGEVVERTPTRLVARWWNPCPTLNACQEFGLDTREICAQAYHRPVQCFVERIDPRLRFDRNYDALRPHTPYCEELLILVE